MNELRLFIFAHSTSLTVRHRYPLKDTDDLLGNTSQPQRHITVDSGRNHPWVLGSRFSSLVITITIQVRLHESNVLRDRFESWYR